MKNIKKTTAQEAVPANSSMIFLTFRIAGQHYGISIDNVIEILQLQPATELPELPPYYKGVINLRGRVIPLMDVNLRFGRLEKEYGGRTCVIIVDIEGFQTGLIVDNVEEVLEINDALTSEPPSFSDDNSSRYITHIARIDENMVLLLNVRLLVSNTDVKASPNI